MEFLGFQATDFDFFKEKDRYVKDDYNKNREEMKFHFRSFCYDIQKIYYSRYGEFFEINKDFNRFNKKSTEICASHSIENGDKIFIKLDAEALHIIYQTENKDLFYKNKNIIWDYILSNKRAYISINAVKKNKEDEIVKLDCLDINEKTFNGLIDIIKDEVKCRISIGVEFKKINCIKLEKKLLSIAFDELMKIVDFTKKLQG